LPFDPDSLDRMRGYVDASIALTATPLAAFGPLVESRGGWAVVVSSVFAAESYRDLPPDLHHYIMAKLAVEGLARSLAASSDRSRYLVARPPRLLTDQTNSLNGRQGALAVEGVAAAIVGCLCLSEPSGKLIVLEDFGQPSAP
jgi:NAD(P)-dependent dehydrogenase (short-subunit alcohol dehydrogenase family)